METYGTANVVNLNVEGGKLGNGLIAKTARSGDPIRTMRLHNNKN